MNWYDEARSRQQELQEEAARIRLVAKGGWSLNLPLLAAIRAWLIGPQDRPAVAVAVAVAAESVHPHLVIVPAGAEPDALGDLPAADRALLAGPAAETMVESDAVVEHRLAECLGAVAVLPGEPLTRVEQPAGQPIVANHLPARLEHRHHKRVGFLRRFFWRVDESSPDALPGQLVPVLLLSRERSEGRRSHAECARNSHHHGDEPKSDHDINEHGRYVHDCTSI